MRKINIGQILFESEGNNPMQIANQLLNSIAKLNWLRQKTDRSLPDSDRKKELYNKLVAAEKEYKESLKAATLEDLYIHIEMVNSFDSFNKGLTKEAVAELKSRDDSEEAHMDATNFLRSH